ncbi:metal-sensing transcriptional repressor [Alkalicoccobacillus porphyridii]|uniref:Metal-sensing transcriptional repressor n=1 Tax=Alkalicoccobacillus porphyridii TaxID=2597270 RepID=A0A553ZVJ7_9BACI|nr:metal-sensing transcriptional repressor [Alkalicoccobacillus porphyridii]TSB45365.1 metal-sensing transcriptional repressor [Alkalicoccobacillus porphyridii]
MEHNHQTVHHRTTMSKEQLTNRLKRIEGQVRGVQKMVEEDRYCVDILTQISAINAAMKKVSLQLLEDHTKHCVADAIKEGEGDASIEELMSVFERFTKA